MRVLIFSKKQNRIRYSTLFKKDVVIYTDSLEEVKSFVSYDDFDFALYVYQNNSHYNIFADIINYSNKYQIPFGVISDKQCDRVKLFKKNCCFVVKEPDSEMYENMLSIIGLTRNTSPRHIKVKLDIRTQRLVYRRYAIQLNKAELIFLDALMRHDKFITHEQVQSLMRDNGLYTQRAKIRVMVSRLCKKLEKHTGMTLIRNSYGVGYYAKW